MRVQQDGDLEVSLGETVTVEIEATNTAFLAHTGVLQVGQWQSVQHFAPSREVRVFTVTSSFSKKFSFAIGFDFSPAPDGNVSPTAKYVVRISGTGPGGFVRQRTVQPAALLPSILVFSCEMGQG
jgi:hypothetical protein